MKIQITNGNPDAENHRFENYLSQLIAILEGQGHSVTHSILREIDLRGCNGCFGCWLKCPGECLLPDDGSVLRRQIIQSDFHLLASPLQMGFPSALLKTVLDKSIPLISPYFDVVHGEAHHRKRYPHYPRLGLLVQEEASTDARDRHIVADIFSRVALNMKSQLDFMATLDQPVETLARAITTLDVPKGVPFDDRLQATSGVSMAPPTRLTIFNGSPRGRKGNTLLLLDYFIRGFEQNPGKSSQVYHLNRLRDRALFREAFEQAECVLLGFPLYVDAMPGQVKAFIEDLADLAGRPGNPPIGFLVQSGFPEALHSRHVERYLEKLAQRLGSPYLGSMLRGGVEVVQVQSEKMNAGLFNTLEQLGRQFGQTGQLDPTLLRALVGVERFPGYLVPVFKLLARTSLLGMYWDQQLKKNGVYAQRDARPYA